MVQTLHLVPSQLGHRVQKVHATSASELLLMFDDGDMRQIDLAPLMLPGTALAGIAQDASLFSRVSIRGRTIGRTAQRLIPMYGI